MLHHHRELGSRHLAGRGRKIEVLRFTPTQEDIEMSIEGKASTPSDARPDIPAPVGSEDNR